MVLKGVFVLSSDASSDHGNGVAVFMLLLWRETIPGRNPTMGYLIPTCSRNGSAKVKPDKPSFDFDPTIGEAVYCCEGHTSLKIRKGLWKTF
jgi:hypothetical protein